MTDEVNETDIAIVGMAIRVPGASNPEEFWANLRNGVEATRPYTDEELLAKGVSQSTLADPNYVKAGIQLQDLDAFDPEFFGFSQKEAAILDPQHRQFYEVCWEALERAGHPPETFEGAVGLFAGCGMGAYFTFNLLSNPELVDSVGLFLLRHTGNDKDFLSTRVSYAFNLHGPCVNVQTACSTSLVATHMAVQSLLSRECDMALAGGVTIEVPHGVGYHYKEGEVLSPDGHCRTFDHRSKGTVFGSGAGVVVLRRLEDALRDGDHVHAVIKGSAVNNDGARKVGYLAPSVDGQAACITEALAVSDVTADTLSYIECHGTATPVGDPIEIAALTQAFRDTTDKVGYCKVGSVKTNIGHLDTAAGVASLIKATLALEHKQIPPSLNFEAPNPRIGFEGSPFTVASKLADWTTDGGPRRAGVNSLGVGGTNAFVVLQEAPARKPSAIDESTQLLVLSGRNRKALDDNAKRLAAWLREHPEQPLADVAYTLNVGRRGFEQRRVLAATNRDEAIALLESNDAKRVFNHTKDLEHPQVVFMFPGGGAQYVRMGAGLYEKEPVFREWIDKGLAILKNRFNADLAPVLLAKEVTPELNDAIAKPSAQLPLTFLVEIALTKLWESYGVEPDMVIGHSMGENAAACIAGVFSFEDGLGLLLLRGQLVEQTPRGSMISVPMAAKELWPLLGSELDLASANSPQLSVMSGPLPPLEALAAKLKEQGIDTQRVKVDVAGHSRLLDGILPRFRQYLQSIQLHEPKIKLVSNFTGKWLEPGKARDPEYWVQHFRNSILFADGVDTLLENDNLVFLEVGPGNMLGSFVRQNPRSPTQRVLSSMRHPNDPLPDHVYFRTVMGRLWALGVDFDVTRLWGKNRHRVTLPSYAFQHGHYWIEPGTGKLGAGRADAERPLRQADMADWFKKPRWVQQGILESDDEPKTWLAFHGREPLSLAMVSGLREDGHTVISVLPGDTYAQVDDNTYTIAAEAGGVGYPELLQSLEERGIVPDRVLHTWLVTLDRAFRAGSTFFHRNQEHGFYSLFHLARALAKAGLADRGLHMTVVSNGALRVGDEALLFPDKATALGPAAVIPREFPNVTCAFVDVDLGAPRAGTKRTSQNDLALAKMAADVSGELLAEPGTRVIAWRNGVRWERHLSNVKSPAGELPATKLREGGVYLITGGLGGIGGLMAEWLAREYKAKLVLLGRTPLPARGEWDAWLAEHDAGDSIAQGIRKVRQLESLGATVLPLSADVAVADRMKEVVDEARAAFKQIHGVFHAAGTIRDSLIQVKSPRDIEDVFSAKVYGTLVLDEIFREQPLDFMVLFSSTSTYIAPSGQIDYVGASAFVNAFAESCRGARPYPVTSIAWGIWKDVGMVGQLGAPADAGLNNDAGVTQGEPLPVGNPHFDKRFSARDGLAQLELFTGVLKSTDWVIDEHRLGSGEALLPGTGYLELVRAALAELGQASGWQLSNLVFENPLFVADGSSREFRVRLRGDEQRWDVEILAAGEREGRFVRCATARVTPAKSDAPSQVDIAAIEARCTGKSEVAAGSGALRTRQESHIRFGPRWRVLKRLQLGQKEAIAQLQLPAEFHGDLATNGLHPGLLDIATGYAMDLIPGYADQDVVQNLWAPISYRGLRFIAPLTDEVHSWVRLASEGSVTSDFAAFDVTLTDAQGNVLAEVDRLTLRRLDGPWHAPKPEAGVDSSGEGATEPATRAKTLSPGEIALRHNVSQGIAPADGLKALDRILRGDMPSEVIVSSMKIDELIAQAESLSRAALSTGEARFSRPELDSDFAPPRDSFEKGLAELWGKLLGVEGVGIHDSFFDLGGHSLIAVRLFNDIADKFEVDLPMSVLMQSPTIEGLATLVRGEAYSEEAAAAEAESGATAAPRQKAELRFRHVVPMHTGPVAGRTPLFVVAGMFGNVLNLSHLAHLLGEDRPFYALQARGLYGDVEPHDNFEEAAADYIAEIVQIQPQGPYLLGGFSGGGLIAYEMARQLMAKGEEVQGVLMLDTPAREIPNFSLGDKLTMLLQSAQREGLGIVGKKIAARIEWEKEKRRRQEERAANNGNAVAAEANTANFQSRRIGDAFLRALAKYKIPKVPVKVAVFRPKLDVKFRLSGGRLVDSYRNYVREDNFWTPHVGHLQVFEVPGNHDNMVLEPNVRVLVSLLRRVIEGLSKGSNQETKKGVVA
ncbi:polyketide synthase [Piscinibacter gummiphilus]|uniref:Beta-ketoacyl synthase N-terminal-like domain-containing protein n=1 Tax=Piscinibacter gummiphilus TaxID=946333 RepID=A0ABZ0CS08_9BURK|nr:polyketide synthase [Piscinibacter gummiphilus]WOB07296.1 beta-ketoacyl synthase N-terminal-like domain-containing protein [Piscinibacter gummiphilus]